MSELHFATEPKLADEQRCSWTELISAVRRYADAQPAEQAEDLHLWADLLEGVRQLRTTSC